MTDAENANEENSELLKQVNNLRDELEYDVMVENWNDCNQVVGLLSAFDLDGVIGKVKVKADNPEGFIKVSAVAITIQDFDKLRKLLAKII
jgi:hypothetical protein